MSSPKEQNLNTHLLTTLERHFREHQLDVDPQCLSLLHRGGFANAQVVRYHKDELDIVIKDFSHTAWPIKATLGRLFIHREAKALARLQGIPGVASRHCRIDATALAYPYVKGQSLTHLKAHGQRLPKDYFTQLEQLVTRMHARGVAHLDMRNLGNILCDSQGQPHVIDFQSAVSLGRAPRWLQRLMRGADLSGIYKSWARVGDSPVPAYKQRFFDSFAQLRKFWRLKGYPLKGVLGGNRTAKGGLGRGPQGSGNGAATEASR